MPFAPIEAKIKTSLRDHSAATFPSFHPSSQTECALSGLLLWCCIRQLWNNDLKTALKPAKGKTPRHCCAVVQIRAMALQGSWRWPLEPPNSRPWAAWLPLASSFVKARQEQSSMLPFWTVHYFECKQYGIQPCQSCHHVLVLNNRGLKGGESCLCVCICQQRSLSLGWETSAGDILREIKCSRFIGEIWLVLMQNVGGGFQKHMWEETACMLLIFYFSA